ncbi:uncharacterized protein LOC111284264 [Durio zibethinus]|uniref:Uncharacterized protein LOC111284264 n=1 Tax=Durio zibethinus TaxID=66656 RepID=A0A6P5XLC6_DURZI|nr:uncharacterized protein LOC111284264 [Durio zibethinus]
MSQPDSSSIPISSFNITTSQSQQANPTTITPSSRALQPTNNNSTSSLFVRRVIVAIVLLFVTIRTFNFIAWRILQPLPPVFEVNSFNISISHGPNSPPNTSYYDIAFTIRNPNMKLSLFMDHFKILVLQGKPKVSSDQWMLTDESVHLSKNRMDFHALKLKGFVRIKKGVNFNVQVNLRTKFLAWNWLSHREFMVVYCRDLHVRFLSAKWKGSFTGEKGECLVNVV